MRAYSGSCTDPRHRPIQVSETSRNAIPPNPYRIEGPRRQIVLPGVDLRAIGRRGSNASTSVNSTAL